MQIADLMAELVAMYPNQLGRPEVAAAWKRRFLEVLGPSQGESLASAWSSINAEWDKASFPRPADIAKRLPKGMAGSVGIGEREHLNRRAEPHWQDLQRQIKDEFLKQIVAGYGNPKARPIVVHGVMLPSPYNPENAWCLFILNWTSDRIDELADYAARYPGEDWFGLMQQLLPDKKTVETAKRMENDLRTGAKKTAGFKTMAGALG